MRCLYRDFDKEPIYKALSRKEESLKYLWVSMAKVQCCRWEEAAGLSSVLQTLQRMGRFPKADFAYLALPWCQSIYDSEEMIRSLRYGT